MSEPTEGNKISYYGPMSLYIAPISTMILAIYSLLFYSANSEGIELLAKFLGACFALASVIIVLNGWYEIAKRRRRGHR